MIHRIGLSIFRSTMRQLRARSGGRFGNRLRSVALEVLRATHNASYDFQTNGETRVVSMIAAEPREGMVVFDVGANIGEWSTEMSERLGQAAVIHAFEPNPVAASRFRGTTRNAVGIQLNEFGLSDATAQLDMDVSGHRSQKSTVAEGQGRLLNTAVDDYRRISAKFVTGDAYCRERGIDMIDLLKIDTEGHDLRVLKGFADMLRDGRIVAIQFEYSRLNIFSRSLLRDHYELMSQSVRPGYDIGRVYPTGVDFRPYSPADENFIDGNFVAVLSGQKALRARLAGSFA